MVQKEACWRRAGKLELDIDLSSRLRSMLIDKEEDRDLQRMSKKEQRVDDGIENQKIVLELGPAYWANSRKWAREQAVTSPDEDGILAVAASIPRKIPTDKQSWRLIQIKQKLELEGFPKPD